jgi:hypothetical protein
MTLTHFFGALVSITVPFF